MTNQRDQLLTGVSAIVLLSAFMAGVFVPQHRKVQRLRAEVAALRAAEQGRAAAVLDRPRAV